MSLASLAIRLATVRALKGSTFAEGNVHDSKIEPLELVAQDEGVTFVIIVTTDDDRIEVEGRDLRAGNHNLDLVIEFVAAAKLTVETGEGGEGAAEVVTIPSTDAGLEATMNLIGWQIMRALTAGGGEWGDLWRTLVVGINEVSSRRGADDTNGVRYAARQYTLTLDHIAEPEPGIAPAEGDAWARVIAMMKSDPEFAGIGRAVEATITADAPEPWERVRASLGLADDESGWISDRPLVDDAGPVAAFDFEDGFTVDADIAETASGPEDGT